MNEWREKKKNQTDLGSVEPYTEYATSMSARQFRDKSARLPVPDLKRILNYPIGGIMGDERTLTVES